MDDTMWDALDSEHQRGRALGEECHLVDGPENRVYSEKFPGILVLMSLDFNRRYGILQIFY